MSVKRFLSALCLAGLAWTWLTPAQAIPSFARQYNRECSSCHNAWPQLNQTGREFKENGYRLPGEVGESVELDTFPGSAVLVARPYDKKDSQADARLRALHEVEIFVGGAIGENFSAILEIEYEDEIDDDSFGQELGFAVLTYHARPEFNIQAVWGESLWADPYGFIGDHFRLTRGHAAVPDQKYGGTDGRIRSTRQSISATGRLGGKFFYNVGLSGDSGDALGVDASNTHFRGAFDITDNFMLGAFLIDGSRDALNRDYSRLGFDAQLDIGNSRISAAYVSGDDDVCGMTDCTGMSVTEDSRDVYSIRWFHTFMSDSGQPGFVPLVRLDHYETANGASDFDELTLNLAYYFRENVKVYLEYWDRDAPTPGSDDSRVTLQAFVAF